MTAGAVHLRQAQRDRKR